MGISGLSSIANTGYSRTELKGTRNPVLFKQKQDDISISDVGKNLKTGFSEGARELWNQIKQPKNLLIGIGATALCLGIMTTLGLTFAAGNFLILGTLTGLALYKTGNALFNSVKHAKNNQNNQAKEDIRNIGKGLFDLTAIAAPFSAVSLMKTVKYTDTFLELSNAVKGSKYIKSFAAGYDAIVKKIAIKLPFKNIKIPRSQSFENFVNWKNHRISYPMKQTRVVKAFNEFPYLFNCWKGKFNVKTVEFIDNKLNLVSLFKNRAAFEGSSAVSLLKEMNKFKPACPKAIDEVISRFGHLGNINYRFKCWDSILKKFREVKPENLAIEMKDIIGTEVIVDYIKNFDDLYGIIDGFAKEGRLIDVKNFHGKKNGPYLDFKKLEEIRQNNNNNFVIHPKHIKKSGYKAVHIRVYEKTTGKPYEIQIKSKIVRRIAKYEHKNYKLVNTEEYLQNRGWFRQLYNVASLLEQEKVPRNKIILGQLHEITNNIHFKVTTIMNDIKKTVGLGTLSATENSR